MRPALCAAVMILAPAALAGPDWTEVGDAPKLAPGQIIPFSPVESISSMLTGLDALGGPDIADMFQVTTIGATTVKTGTLPLSREANFDTVLFLFTANGAALAANDDVAVGDTSSQITIPAAGVYLLAVAPKGVQPFSAGGAMFPIYNPENRFAVVQGDPTAGREPVASWQGTPINPEPRNVVMHLFAAEGIPALEGPALAVLAGGFAIGAVVLLRRSFGGA